MDKARLGRGSSLRSHLARPSCRGCGWKCRVRPRCASVSSGCRLSAGMFRRKTALFIKSFLCLFVGQLNTRLFFWDNFQRVLTKQKRQAGNATSGSMFWRVAADILAGPSVLCDFCMDSASLPCLKPTRHPAQSLPNPNFGRSVNHSKPRGELHHKTTQQQ